MRLSRTVTTVAMAAVLLVAAGCSSTGGGSSASAALTPVKFQLKWVAQTQFAGYYAAVDQGYYKDVGLDVSLLLGGPNINEVQVVATGGADIGTTWLPSMLQSREGGTDLVGIAQVYQRSGTRMASFKAANITTPKDMGGKKIGSWLGGNEPELFAGVDQGRARPDQGEHHQAELRHVGAAEGRSRYVAQAMIYNEYAQVLEAKNPTTGELYQPTDFNVIDFNDPAVGTAMLQDQIFASDKWLKTGTTRTSPRSSCRRRSRAGSTAATTPRSASTSSWKGLAARRQPPGVADERDQRAHLAVAERHRPARQDALRPDRHDRHDLHLKARPPQTRS